MCGKAWRSHWLMTQLTNGQYDCVLVFMSMVDILNITCNCPFVFAVLDAVGNILRVMKCNTSFSQRSKSTLFRWGEHVICVCVKCSSCMCKNYKNQMSFSRVMITNVLQRFLWTTLYNILYWMMQVLMKHNSRQKDISTVIQQNISNRRSINRILNCKICQKVWHHYHCFNWRFYGKPKFASSSLVCFLHLFPKRTYRDKWYRLFMGPDVPRITEPTVSNHRKKHHHQHWSGATRGHMSPIAISP